MTFDHAEYARLENAYETAKAEYRIALRRAEYKRPPAGAAESAEAALTALRETGDARFAYEMAHTRIVDIATLPPAEYVAALFPTRRA